MVNAEIHTDGTITGNRKTLYFGQYAASIRSRYHAAKDSIEFINKLETEESIKIKKFQTSEIQKFSPQVTESFDFEKQVTVNDNLIYVNPMIFLHTNKCPFIQTERQLPLEMPYTEQITLVVYLTIPQGYAIDELPKSQNAVTGDGQGYCRYNITQADNQIKITYNFAYNKLLHLANEYPDVKSFWELIAEKNNEIMVLKKL